MGRKWVKTAAKWTALAAYLTCAVVILAESAVDGPNSSNQSDQVTGTIQDAIDKNYDKNAVKDLRDFAVSFSCDDSFSVFVGEIVSFSVAYSPVDTSYRNLVWEYEESSVSLSETEGTLSFLQSGDIPLSVHSQDKESVAHTYLFHVHNIPVTEVKCSAQTLKFNYGDPGTSLEWDVLPEDATDKAVSFSSSKPEVASVSEEGFVKPLDSGDAVITIQSNDNPEALAKVKVTVGKKDEIQIPIARISAPAVGGILNENVKTMTFTGSFYDSSDGSSATFVPSLLHVSLDAEYQSYFTLGTPKKAAAGKFSFTLSLKNATLADSMGWDEKSIPLHISYDLEGVEPIESSFLVKKAKTLSLEDIDSLSVGPTNYITLEKLSHYVYCDPLKATVKLKSGLVENDYKKTTYSFELKKASSDSIYPISTYFSKTSKTFKSFSLTPASGLSCPEDGVLRYYPNKAKTSEYKEVEIHYEDVHDQVTDQLSFSLTKLFENQITDFLVGQEYTGIFGAKMQSNAQNTSVANSLKSSEIHFQVADESLVELGKTGFTFLSRGTTTLFATSKITGETISYRIRGVQEPNLFKPHVNGKAATWDFDSDPVVEIGRGERVSFDVDCYYKALFADGSSQTSDKMETSLSCTLDNGYENNLLLLEDGCTLQGIIQNSGDDPIPVSFHIFLDGEEVKVLSCKVRVTYIAVDPHQFDFSLETVMESNEYNLADWDHFQVPVGTVFRAKAHLNSDATNPRVVYSCDDPSVLDIDSKTGLAKAVKSGEAIVKMTSVDDDSIFVSKKIRVRNTASPFQLDLEKMTPSKFQVVTKEDGSIDHYEIELLYGQPYRVYIQALVPSTCSSMSFKRIPLEGNTSTCVRIDQAGNIATRGVGTNAFEVIYGGGEESMQSYSQIVYFTVTRTYVFTFQQLSVIVRKSLGHFGLFAFTAIWSVLFVILGFKKAWTRYAGLGVSAVSGFALAGFSELIQLYTPGRAGRWMDVGIDTAGYCATLVLAALILGAVYLVRYLLKKKKNVSGSPKEED